LAPFINHNRKSDIIKSGLWNTELNKRLGSAPRPKGNAGMIIFTPTSNKIITTHATKPLNLWDAKKIVRKDAQPQ
jgi:hypothetical protein